MSVILFFVVLFVLILVHEWGHFIVAKKTNMRVDEFGIGFPPRLLKKQWGETLYSLNALPIGGFVRIWGENYEDKKEGEEGAEIAVDSDSSRAFSARPKWAQALVLIAGVTMNVLFAWFLFTLTFAIGVPTAVEEATAGPDAELYIAQTIPDSPATALLPGSVILEVKSESETLTHPTPSAVTELVTNTAGAPLLVEYRFGDSTETIELVPVQGLIANDPERYAIGASLALVEIQSQPLHTAMFNGLKMTYEGFTGISVGLYTLVKESFVGTADFSQIAGPVGIVGLVGDAAAYGFTALLTFTAIISLNLAVINLLPFPALDGGRLLFVAIETITRRPIPPEWAGRLNLVGFALLMILMIAVTYNDIARLL